MSSYRRYAITYLRTRGGWIYLTVVLDRYVMGWALSADLETVHTTISALRMAFANRTACSFIPTGVRRSAPAPFLKC